MSIMQGGTQAGLAEGIRKATHNYEYLMSRVQQSNLEDEIDENLVNALACKALEEDRFEDESNTSDLYEQFH
jgi:hypothetical protein